jgi:type 1 fimbria pilin
MNDLRKTTCDSTMVMASPGSYRTKFPGARLAQTFFVCLVMLGSIHAQADSIHVPYNNSNLNANFDNLAFSSSFSPAQDVAIGTVLQSVSANSRITYGTTCNVSKVATVNGTPVPGMTDTFQTNVPGIGVHFYVTVGWNGNGNGYTSVPSNETLSASSHNDPANFYTRADLVVTGPVGNGTLTYLPSMTLAYSGDCIPGYTKVQALTTGTLITGRTCSITTPSVAVTLPAVTADGLATVGSTKGSASFSLGVNCSQSMNVSVTMTDASNVANSSTTLGLTPDSSATGVGLQIVNGSTPIAYGPDSSTRGNTNQWPVGTVSSGPTTIPLTVRYVRTAGTLTPGTVKGTATFTMSYQ